MSDTTQLPADIVAARQKGAELSGIANSYQSQEPQVADILRQKVIEAYDNNSDVIKALDPATANYYSAPSVAREKYLTPGSPNYVANPFQAESLVSQYTNNAAVPMLSYGNILGQRMGRIQDLIGTGVDAYKSATQAAALKAQQAQQNYQNLLGEYQLTKSIDEQNRQFQLDLDKLNFQKSQSGKPTANDKLIQKRQEAVTDAANYTNLTSLHNKYDATLGAEEVTRIYTSNSPWGIPNEPYEKGLLGIKEPEKTAEQKMNDIYTTYRAAGFTDAQIKSMLLQGIIKI